MRPLNAAPPPRVELEGGPESHRGVGTCEDPTPGLYQRCADGRPCCEVLERLLAADRSERVGMAAVAAQLRETAKRFAEAHGQGSR